MPDQPETAPEDREALTVIASPTASKWLIAALKTSLERDPVDAANDAEFLLELLVRRATAIARNFAAVQPAPPAQTETSNEPPTRATTWIELVDPIAKRMELSAKLGMESVYNSDGALALATLIREMAAGLDRANSSKRRSCS